MITYKKGDATNPEETGHKYIIHVTNTVGGYGAGFVVALNRKWPKATQFYRDIIKECRDNNTSPLGKIYSVDVDDNTTIVHMMAQKFLGIRYYGGNKVIPLSYDALENCLKQVADMVLKDPRKPVIVAPRFGSGLAGGTWENIEEMINNHLINRGIEVIIYDIL